MKGFPGELDMTERARYAWWKAPTTSGIPEAQCPVPFRALQVVPGMDGWLLVHLAPPVEALPGSMISAKEVASLIKSAIDRPGDPSK